MKEIFKEGSFAEGMILYVRKPKDSIKRLLKLTGETDRVADTKLMNINITGIHK